MELDLLKLATVRGQGSSCGAGVLLPVDPFPQTTSTKGVPRTLVVAARYVERIVAGARFMLQVARRLPPRLDLGRLNHLVNIDVGGRSQTEEEGPMTWHHPHRALGSFAHMEGNLHHADDALHCLNEVIGFGRVGLYRWIRNSGGDRHHIDLSRGRWKARSHRDR
jgi:hypothetical protein